ncbi:MAG TPA: hypothetical protein VMF50_13220 [Candidatus Binataceae bacterium]|nr:hypothetical protein [Candidatus Binataceae bacterium]
MAAGNFWLSDDYSPSWRQHRRQAIIASLQNSDVLRFDSGGFRHLNEGSRQGKPRVKFMETESSFSHGT